MHRDETPGAPARPDLISEENLFNSALEQPPEERAAFLLAACNGNPELHARLKRLLACFVDKGDLLEELPIDALNAEDPDLTAKIPGQRLGPYELIRQLATGGMGTVWLARRADDQFDKQVALKLIKHGMDSEALLARFRTERQVLASLEHASIARLLDAGLAADGLPYLVMEYVDGLPIDRFCDERRLTVPQRLELFRVVLGGVQYAHQNLVVHRDLKPSNVLVSADGSPKIVDFGIAKVLHPSGADAPGEATAPQFRIMTPRYASPEQVRGEKVTTASDIYSMGVVLFELLTGHEPYDLSTRSQAEYERAICDQEPQRPSTAVGRAITRDDPSSEHKTITPQTVGAARNEDPRKLQRRLSGDLDMIVLKALRKDPQRRYATAEQFSEDLRRHLAHLPILARPDSWLYRSRKLAARNSGAVAGATIVAIALLAATGISYRFGKSEARQRKIAEESLHRVESAELLVKKERDSAATERDKAVAVAEFLIQALKSQDPRESGRQDILVSDAMRQAVDILDRGQLSSQPETEGTLLNAVALILEHAGKSDEGTPLAARALAIRQRVHGGDHADVAESLNSLGLCLQGQSQYAEALTNFQASLEMSQRLFNGDNASIAAGLANVAGCLQVMGHSKDALPKYEQALAMRARLFDRDHPDVAMGRRQLAGCLLALGRPAEALPNFQSSLEMYQRLFKGDHAHVAIGLYSLGRCLRELGRLDDALKVNESALEMIRRLDPSDRPAVALALNNVAVCLEAMGRSAEALPRYEESLRIYERIIKSDNPETARALNNLGSCLLSLGRPQEALAKCQAALEMSQRLFKDDNPDLASVLNVMGRCLTAKGNPKEAMATYEEALAMNRRIFQGDHPSIAAGLTDLGLSLNATGRTADALANYEEALAMNQRIYSGDHPNIAGSLCNVAVCLQALGRSAEALPKIQEGFEMRKRLFQQGNIEIEVARAFLGVVLVDLNRYDDAEPMLLAAMLAMDRDKSLRPARKKRGIDALVKLYEARDAQEPSHGYAEKAQEWRARLQTH